MAAAITRRSAFSLAEVLLSLALITLVVLALLGTSLYCMGAGSKSRDLTAGAMVAEQVLERLAYDADTNSGAAFWAVNNPTAIYQQEVVTIGPCPFNVTTHVSNVEETVFAAPNRLKRVDAVVIWQDAQQGKAQQGRLQIRASRLVHER